MRARVCVIYIDIYIRPRSVCEFFFLSCIEEFRKSSVRERERKRERAMFRRTYASPPYQGDYDDDDDSDLSDGEYGDWVDLGDVLRLRSTSSASNKKKKKEEEEVDTAVIDIAKALAAFCKSEGKMVERSVMGTFYQSHPPLYKAVIQRIGLKTFVLGFPDLLTLHLGEKKGEYSISWATSKKVTVSKAESGFGYAEVKDSNTTFTERKVAQMLAQWCGSQKMQRNSLGSFYASKDPSVKEVIQKARMKGLKNPGLKAFVLKFPDILTLHRGTEQWDYSISSAAPPAMRVPKAPAASKAKVEKSTTAATEEEIEKDETQVELETAAAKSKDRAGTLSLEALNARLEELKGNETMRQFAQRMKESGLCLKDGKLYGKNKLSKKLRNDKWFRVNKEQAKKYKFVKQCLLHMR